jgi:hypothetical protein
MYCVFYWREEKTIKWLKITHTFPQKVYYDLFRVEKNINYISAIVAEIKQCITRNFH